MLEQSDYLAGSLAVPRINERVIKGEERRPSEANHLTAADAPLVCGSSASVRVPGTRKATGKSQQQACQRHSRADFSARGEVTPKSR